MATPALRALRHALPGAFIGVLARPGIDELLAGLPFFDEVHTDRATGMMGPKRVASRLRVRRYDAAILFTNSFSTALVARLAGIPRRFGYDRDGRGLLLTDKLVAPLRRDTPPFSRSATAPGEWAPIPACDYYAALARHFLARLQVACPPMGAMELAVAPQDASAADAALASVPPGPLVLLNPGGNNPAKRWPADRFAALAAALIESRGVTVLLSGAPTEAPLTASIADLVPPALRSRVIDLPALASPPSLRVLKAIIARCALMVTNDTGPRHIAAALNVPVVTLFGPTDHRWTTIPFDRERIILADPTLPEEEVANDHPQRCAIERIDLARVQDAALALLPAPVS